MQKQGGGGVNFYEVADVRTFRQNSKYDSCISLFHVASYQNSDEDVKKYFDTAAFHLKGGGLFIFDAWYKPAVLNLLPEKRMKTIENSDIKVIRYCEPEHIPSKSIVKVNYKIVITDKKTNAVETVNEIHSMRYFSVEEIKEFALQSNIKIINAQEWLTKAPPDNHTWSVCFEGIKI